MTTRALPAKMILAVTELSLLAFAVRGIKYAVIGAYLPIAVAAILALLYYGLRRFMPHRLRLALRIWGVLLCVYAIIRLALFIVLTVDPSVSAHAADSFGGVAAIVSLLYLAGGVYLFKANRRDNVSTESQPDITDS
ncbi:MAG: hypothetical protein AAF004_05325 [Pseudomonadota bacterium]